MSIFIHCLHINVYINFQLNKDKYKFLKILSKIGGTRYMLKGVMAQTF